MGAPWVLGYVATSHFRDIRTPTTTRQRADRRRWRIWRGFNNMSQTMNITQLLENALASYQAAANELIAELKRQRNDLLEENAMLKRDIAKLDNFLANQDE